MKTLKLNHISCVNCHMLKIALSVTFLTIKVTKIACGRLIHKYNPVSLYCIIVLYYKALY